MPERIQRRRTKGWRMPAGAKYVGRPGFWGNPFRGARATYLYEVLWDGDWKELERQGVPTNTFLYLCWLHERQMRHVHELRDLDLACWCPLDRPCHADVLLRKANAEKQA